MRKVELSAIIAEGDPLALKTDRQPGALLRSLNRDAATVAIDGAARDAVPAAFVAPP